MRLWMPSTSRVSPLMSPKLGEWCYCLGGWLKKSYKQAVTARALKEQFVKLRTQVAMIPKPTWPTITQLLMKEDVAVHVNPMQTLRRFTKGLTYKSFALSPLASADELKGTQLDFIILSAMGVVRFDGMKVELVMYPDLSEEFVHMTNRMMAWDSSVRVQELRDLVPKVSGVIVTSDQAQADRQCRCIKTLLEGGTAEIQDWTGVAAAASASSAGAISASQVLPPSLGHEEQQEAPMTAPRRRSNVLKEGDLPKGNPYA